MAKLSSILVLLAMNLVVVGTASAAILVLNNSDTTNPLTWTNWVTDPSFVDSISKTGSGTDIVPISLTNTGNTTISSGQLQFSGLVTNLSNVTGSNLSIGGGTKSSIVTVNFFSGDTLTIAAGSTLVIRAIGSYGNPPDPPAVPEPVSWVIWLLIGSIAVLTYRRRR